MPPEKERANPELNLDLDNLPIGRTLGPHWDANSDTFQFTVIPTSKPPTKLGILSTVSSLFDPLGFLSPFILPMEVLLQERWRIGVQWDETNPEPLLTQWRKWSIPPPSQISRFRDGLDALFRMPSPISSCITGSPLHVRHWENAQHTFKAMIRSTFRTPGRCNLCPSLLDDYGRIGPSNQQRHLLDRFHDSFNKSSTKKEDIRGSLSQNRPLNFA